VIDAGFVGDSGLGALVGRKLASGVGASCPSGTTTVIGTFTRRPGEVIKLMMFPSNDSTAMVWAEGQGPTSIWTDYRRTANPNEFTFGVANVSGVTAVVDWALIAVQI